MNIGILTHPLKSNYGGILQNFALQNALKNMGHDVKTINIGKKFDTFSWIVSLLKYPIKRIIDNKIKPPLTKHQTRFIEQNIDSFINKYISTTEPLLGIDKNIIYKYNFEAIIVGSDQVWRPNYVRNIQNMFLNFLNDSVVKRIAFAASFGVDYWTFSKKQEIRCAKEAKKFNAISVRENSGIQLCEKYLNVKAEHIMDPTILLTKEEYKSLSNTQIIKIKNQLTVYIIDLTKEKQYLIEKIAKMLDLSILHINNHAVKDPSKNYKERIAPPIENWIAGFVNADYVITDSFHGTIFSIIFNKPFITLSNRTRGLTRIMSLLNCFNLEKQLIADELDLSNIDDFFNVDFSYANKTLAIEKIKAIRFLKNSLK